MFGLPILVTLFLYILAFGIIWFSSGLVVDSVSQISHRWRLSSFTVSFFLLGTMTSLPEIAIGSIAVLQNDPLVYVGTLLGGVIVIFLAVIPLMVLLGGKVLIPRQVRSSHLFFTLLVVIAPALLTGDRKLVFWEGVLLTGLYCALIFFFFHKQSVVEKIAHSFKHLNRDMDFLLLKIIGGVMLLVGSSYFIVNTTIFFAEIISISPFFLSIIVVALGTNIPELALILRSLMMGKREIALADYLGSASTNTLMMGLLTIAHGSDVILPNNFLQRISFVIAGLVLFYVFARTNNSISRREGGLLFLLYILFVFVELSTAHL